MPVDASCPLAFLAQLNVSSAGADYNRIVEDLRASLPASITLASVLLLVSLVMAFAGARLVKPTFAVIGFAWWWVFGLVVSDAILQGAPALSPGGSCALIAALPLGLGLVGAIVNVCMLSFAFAVTGLLAGTGGGYFLYVAALHNLPTSVVLGDHDLTYWLTLVVCALVGMAAMLRLKHTLLVIATALVGTVGAVPALALLLGHADGRFLWILDFDHMTSGQLRSPYVYGLLIGGVALFLCGLGVQCATHATANPCARKTAAVRAAQVPLIISR